MNITRRTWVSAGVVSAILVGGVSVAAAATAGRASGVDGPVNPAPPAARQAEPPASDTTATAPRTSRPPDGSVVSREVNPDPAHVARYWTKERLREAEPFPMPVAEGLLDVSE